MSDEDRGKIRNREQAQQLRDFSKLRFGKITPTDIDGFIEFQDKAFIFIEAKYGCSALPYGQRLALERLCDAISSTGRFCSVLVAHHSCSPTEDIDFGLLKLSEYRINGKWIEPTSTWTLKEAIEVMKDGNDIDEDIPE